MFQSLRDSQPETPHDEARSIRPIVNVRYEVTGIDTPAFRDLQDQIKLINGRLTKYFETKGKGANQSQDIPL